MRGRESPAAMSLRHTETNLRHTEASLPDRHTVQEPPPYSTRASVEQYTSLCRKERLV